MVHTNYAKLKHYEHTTKRQHISRPEIRLHNTAQRQLGNNVGG
jgi:hypothetical protein